jgi:hypothetical protein
MSMLDRVNLLQDLNISTIPLEISNGLSNSEILMGIQAKVDQIIDVGNAWAEGSNKYTDEQTAIVQKELDALMVLLNNGNIIPDHSIDIKKLNVQFLEDLQLNILDYIGEIAKFVWFGINKEGYFYAVIPKSWDSISFSTNSDGCLVLELIDTGSEVI